MALKVLTLKGEEAVAIARAISTEANFKILRLLSKERLDVSTIAKKLGLSEPYISEEIKLLQKLQLVTVTYAPGKRGIKKICELAVGKIIIEISPRS